MTCEFSSQIMLMRWSFLFIPTLVVVIVWLALTERLPAWFSGVNEIPVSVVRVQKLMLPATVHSDGVLKPARESEIFSRLAGKVTELRIKEGDRVAAGAVVATIYSNSIAQRQNDLEAMVAAAQKELQQRESELDAAETLAVQRRDLLKRDLIARREFEQSETAAQTARAQAELARAHLSQQDSMLAQTRKVGSLTQVTAPVSGLVSRRLVKVGAAVGEATPIMVLVIDRSLKFSGRVASRLASEIRRGLKATIFISSAPEKKFEGVVLSLAPSAENGDLALDIEIHSEKPAPELSAGMAAQASIFLNRLEPALSLPAAAVINRSGKSYVLKMVAGRAVRQDIKLGAMADGEIAIVQGIGENDLVIVGALNSIQSGRRVRPLEKTAGVNGSPLTSNR